jgi:transposase InsO family protein
MSTSAPSVIQVRVSGEQTTALADTGSDLYATISFELAKSSQLQWVSKEEKQLKGFSDKSPLITSRGFVRAELEVSGYTQVIFAHVVQDLGFPLILGRPWFEHNHIIYEAAKRRIWHGVAGIYLRLRHEQEPIAVRHIREAQLVPSSVFAATAKRLRRRFGGVASLAIRSISITDINKALEKKEPINPADYIPHDVLEEFPQLFTEEAAGALPPHRPGVDHKINLQRDSDGSEPPLPWGPLYNMSREELLVLRKTLNDLLEKGYIRASASPAAAPVLFVKKPGGGLRFCCDYRALNMITKKDRYPLPLISETLRTLAKAQWLTQLDVVAAFHKIRMAPGHEEKTAFRTRYGLYEWLVCPFGLSGAPATFQRYINQTLRVFLDDFATAYMDDVLVYSSGSRKDHMQKVRRVLRALTEAGLTLDPKKCRFAVQEVRYVGFMIKAGEGIYCDPEKIRAIQEWAAPSSLKGIQAFLGFANYYRIFIENFAEIIGPLVALTKKGVPYYWGPRQDAAFSLLKRKFTEAPILRDWDPDAPTIIETDCSGYALGAIFTQIDPTGQRYVVAYYSRRLTPEEFNYPIHDKELLAIIACFTNWRAMLSDCATIVVLTDHKNLRYFQTKRALTERQTRWSETLSEFKFTIRYRPGRLAVAPDALSRRDQDAPADLNDERIKGRERQLLPDHLFEARVAPIRRSHGEITADNLTFPADPELQELWDQATASDIVYRGAYTAVQQGARSFPPELGLKLQIAECNIDFADRLTFRGRLWVPALAPSRDSNEGSEELLRTQIIQREHDSFLGGHPGRDATIAMLCRSYFWPGQNRLIRQFIRNCDICRRSHIWREAKKGLLQPLPIPDRAHQDLSMDFITDLPPTGPNSSRYLLVITDRLTREVVLEALPTMEAEACAQRFLECYYRYHGAPSSIVSDRGTNWTSDFWRYFCVLAGITQRLSTSYHPQTDGSTERKNQDIEAYLRAYVTYNQSNWGSLLPSAQLSLNSRDHSATKMSPFFATHGFHPQTVELNREPKGGPRSTGAAAARALVSRHQEVADLLQSASAATQQLNEDSANKRRSPAERFEVGDKVWLHMGNYHSPRPSKKLDWLHQKYTVTKVLGTAVVELNVPTAIYPRFHTDMLRRASTDPAPGQIQDDIQPPPIIPEGAADPEWEVEKILCARSRKRGRGQTRQCLVKWAGYAEPTWCPISDLAETAALEEYETLYGPIANNDGPLQEYTRQTKRQTRM